MDTKEKLVELLKNIPQVNHYEAQVHGYDYVFGCAADFLIDSGVTIPVRCKECEFNHPYIALDGRRHNNCTHDRCSLMWLGDEHFCSYGDRKDNG